MNTPISWIKAYVPDLDCTVQEYVDKMTLSGSHVENAVYLDKNLEKIVVGRIEKIEKHPDADKLVICQVNVGDEEVQIVTGASNVFKGAMVPVVLDGGRVAGGHDGSPNPENGIKIKKGKLRGVPSYGMMCSIEELGSTRDMYPEAPEDGIYIFDESKDVKPGDDAVAALGLRDAVVEFEITSNRVDCFSMIGMAREAAATFEKPFYAPEVKEVGNNEKAEDYISVEVEATDLCPRYTARIVKNIKLAPSPEWMQRRLAAMGIRPINNIVDITNYVLKELGQLDRPILLKRGLNATYEEWIMSAEYIMASGNENVILCERGIRTFESYTRNTLDLQSIPVLRKLTHLPIIVDPSHAGGKWWLVDSMAMAAVAAGADGLMIEVHNDPESALCDGAQSLKPKKYDELIKKVSQIAGVVGKTI